MKVASVGSIQKNFSAVLSEIRSGEKIVVTKRGEPVALLMGLGPRKNLNWPDFFNESIPVRGGSTSQLIIDMREDRF